MRSVRFTNSRGDSINIAPGVFPFTLGKITGTGGEGVTANNHFEKSPYQDGSTYLDTDLETRELNLVFDILTDTEEECNTLRRSVSRIFNPKLGEGELIYKTEGEEYRIMAVPDTTPRFLDGLENRSPGHQKCEISLTCSDPYWTDKKETETFQNAFEKLFEFPVSFPVEFGTKGALQIYTNIGDEETPIEIAITGPATNPRITNQTTGEYIQYNRELYAGETLIITTGFGNKRAEIDYYGYGDAGGRENVFNWIDEGSVFFQLQPGENYIFYSADAGDINAIFSIKYRNRYIGV